MGAGLLLPLTSSPVRAQPEEPQPETNRSLSDIRSEKNGWYLDLTPLATLGQLAVGYDYGKTRVEAGGYGLSGQVELLDGSGMPAFISGFLVSIYTDAGAPEARWSPYSGCGLGYGVFGITDGNTNVTSTGGFSYRGSGGLSYAITASMDLNMQIGYQFLGDADLGKIEGFGGGLG